MEGYFVLSHVNTLNTEIYLKIGRSLKLVEFKNLVVSENLVVHTNLSKMLHLPMKVTYYSGISFL